MDPESWDWESSEAADPVLNPGSILEIVFTREEVALVEPLAHAEGKTLHEFVKQAAMARAASGDEVAYAAAGRTQDFVTGAIRYESIQEPPRSRWTTKNAS